MSQQTETILPRRRSRAPLAPVSRADQSTRVLIQVPAVAAGPTAAPRPAVGAARPTTRDTNQKPGETTIGSAVGSASDVATPMPTTAIAPVETAKPVEKQPDTTRTVRIDAAHAEPLEIHAAAAGWLPRTNGLLTSILQRNSLLATAVIVVVVGLLIFRVTRPDQRGPSSENKPFDGNPTAIVDQNKNLDRGAEAKSLFDTKRGPRLPAERSASDRGKSSAKASGDNPTADVSTTGPPLLNPGHLKGVHAPEANNPAIVPPGWNAPAAANAPAAIEAQLPPNNRNRFTAAPSDVSPPFNLARRDVPAPLGSFDDRRPASAGGAVFEGGIERLPIQAPQ
jgi:hypothetical protein